MALDTSKIIHAPVGGGRYTVTSPIVKEDYGLYLLIEGLELPSTYEVDFSNSEHNGTSVTMIGNADGVLIPRQFITTGKDVFAFLYHVGDNYGRTVFKFRIPNKLRPDRTDEQPTPEEQSTIDQAISALNSAVEQTAQDVIDADASAQSAQGYAEQAETAKSDAQTYANNASASATSASQSATASANSATASAQSASQSAQIKTDVEDLVDDAQGYAQASEQSAQASANSASQASGYATSASQSASSAQGYASQAQTSASTASTKASEASTSASTASQKATESAQSASQALTYKTDAESAKTSAQTAQGLAESARDTAVQAKTDAESAKADAESARDEAQTLVDSISGKTEQIDSNTDRIESLEDDRYKPYAVDSASGSIASFPDGADDIPLKSLVIDINPVQDLHGQDSPYPAGGGKNKLHIDDFSATTKNGVTFSCVDGVITANGTATADTIFVISPYGGTYTIIDNIFDVEADTTYVMSGSINGSYNTTWWLQLLISGSGAEPHSAYGDSATFSFTAEQIASQQRQLAIRFKNGTAFNNVKFYPMIRLSSVTDATFAPYSNICPISGWTQVGVEQSGVNVWDGYVEDGALRESNGEEYPATLNKRSGWISVSGGASYYFRRVDSTIGTGRFFFYDANKQFLSSIMHVRNNSFTTPSNASYMRLLFTNLTLVENDISINYPSTDHDYHPYTGRSITIDLGQTVYGGKLDVLSGKLTVYPYYASYNGETLTGEWISDRDVYAVGTTPTIGAQVVNIGAEGTEIQLDAHAVNSLPGANNIFADTGDCEVEYRADTRLYIEKLTQPTEDDMIANSAITSGQFFMVGNSLYRALANIASGATITVGTNAQRVSLSDALNLVNA